MKKLIKSSIAAFLLLVSIIVQATTFQVTGTVTSNTTNLPVANHQVYIMSDSNGTSFNYYNVVTTNANGEYYDIITIPANLTVVFQVLTMDCNQGWNAATFIGTPSSTNFLLNFSICTTTPAQCQAGFYAFPDSGSSALAYYFSDLSTGNPVNWLWSFGDGGTSALQYPMHTYAQSGYYNVCLTISNGLGCTSTFCDTLYVGNVLPNCYNYFTSTAQLLNVTFLGSAYGGTAPYSYSWDFGDGATSYLQNPTHTYAQSGYYNVMLVTTDALGCTSASTQYVNVSNNGGNCQANFQAYPDSSGILTYYFVNLSTGSATNFQWNFGDNTVSTSQFPYHTYAQAGTYYVCLTIWNNAGCQSSFCDTLIVGAGMPCSSYFYYGTQLTYASFYGYAYGGTAPYSFLWSFGDGTGSSVQNPSHTYASSGTYTVTLTTTDANGCSFTSSQPVVISTSNPLTLWGQVTAGTAPVDYGRIYLFGVNPAGNSWYIVDTTSIDSVGYYWFSNVYQGTYAIIAELSPNSSMFGQYMPTYYGNTIFWSSASLITLGQPINPYNIDLQVSIPPFAGPGNISGTITTGSKLFGSGAPLPNIEIMLLDMSNNPLILDYSDASGNFSFSNLPYGTYKVYAEVGGINTNPAVITLNAAAPNSNNVSLLMTSSGITIGIENHETISVNKLYPNPASDNLSLELNTLKSGSVTMIISDILGNEVLANTSALTTGSNKLNINTSELTPGSYSLQCVLSDGSRIVRKIAIVR